MTKLGCILSTVLLLSSAALANKCLNMKISGYMQPRWQATLGDSAMENSFRIRRASIGIGGSVGEIFSYKVVALFPGDAIKLGCAYVDVKPFKYFGVRLGQILTPFGFEKQRSSSAVLFPERSFASGHKLFPLINTDIGIMAYSDLNIATVKLGLFNGSEKDVTNDNKAKDIYANLSFKPFKFLHVGASYSTETSIIIDTVTTTNRWGADFSLTPWNLWLAAEYMHMDASDNYAAKTTYYAEAAWMFKTNACTWMYGIQPAVRYEFVDPNLSSNTGARTIITSGINIHILPKDKAKLALCYRIINEEETDIKNNQIIAQFQLKFPHIVHTHNTPATPTTKHP